MADHELQIMEQQRLIEQLKAMIRDSEEVAQKKDKELQDLGAKLSKMKLQAKAKLAKEAKDAKEGKGGKSGLKKLAEEVKDEKKEDKADEDDNTDRNTRAKSMLMKRKLEDKDRIIKEREESVTLKDQQIEVKEKIIVEREEIIRELTRQLESKTTLMEELSQAAMAQDGGTGENDVRIQQMYAQIVYKDKNLMEMNNKILELERRLIDTQEYIGEKNEVIRGRDKVIQILQSTLKDKDQTISDQSLLVTKLTGKVETNDENLGHLREQVEKSEHDLKLESDRFNLRLTESQKYFEETLKEQEENIERLRNVVKEKEAKLLVSENDLRELISRHERDIQKIMSKGEVNLQDPVIQMLEHKLKDTNELLEGKIKVIEVLQKESSKKDKELEESREVQKSFKEKLQEMSEKMLLFQANVVDMEAQWNEERKKFRSKINDIIEKHEHELSEKDLQIETLRSSSSQLEVAYTESVSQYGALQERFQQTIKPGVAVPMGSLSSGAGSGDGANVETQLAQMAASLKEKEQQLEEYDCLKMKLESVETLYREKEEENAKLKEAIAEKVSEIEEVQKKAEEATHTAPASTAPSGSAPGKGDAKMLKMKAQLTSKVKALEKQLAELKQGGVSNEDMEALQQDVNTLREERDSLKSQLENVDKLKSSQGALEGQLADLEAKIKVMEGEKEVMTSDLATLNFERDQLQVTVTQLQDDLVQAQESDQSSSLLNDLSSVRKELSGAHEMASKSEAEADSLKTELQEKDKEICQLHAHVSEKQKAVESAVSLMENSEIEVGRLRNELQEINNSQKLLQEELTDACAKKEELLISLQMKETDISDFLRNIDSGEENLQSAAKFVQKCQEKENMMKEELQKLSLKISEVVGENNELQSQRNSLEEKHKAEMKELNDMLLSKVSESEASAKQKAQLMQADLDKLLQIKIDLEDQVSSTHLLVSQHEREIDMLQERQHLQGSEIDDKVQSLLSQISALEKQCLEMKNERDAVKASFAESQSENELIRSSINEFRDDIEQQKHHFAEQLSEQEKLLNQKSQALADLQTEDNQTKEELSNYLKILEDTRNDANVTQDENESLREQLGKLKEECISLCEEKDQLGLEIKRMSDKTDGFEHSITQLKSDLSVANHLNDERAQSIDSLKSENKKLTDHLTDVQEDLQEVSKKLTLSEESFCKFKAEYETNLDESIQEREKVKSDHDVRTSQMICELESLKSERAEEMEIAKSKMDELIKQNSDIGAKQDDAVSQAQELRQQLLSSEETLCKLKTEFERKVEQYCSDTETMKVVYEAKVDGLTQELDLIKTRSSMEKTVLEGELRKIKDEKTSLHSQDSLSELQKQLHVEKSKADDLENQLHELRVEISVSEQKFIDLNKSLLDKEQESGGHRDQLSLLTDTLEVTLKEKEKLVNDLKNAEEQLNIKSDQMVAIEQNTLVLENEKMKLTENVENRDIQCNVILGNVEGLTVQLESLQSEFDSQRRLSAEKEQSVTSQFEKKVSECTELSERYNALCIEKEKECENMHHLLQAEIDKSRSLAEEKSLMIDKVQELEMTVQELSCIAKENIASAPDQIEVENLTKALAEKDVEIAKLKSYPVELVFEEGESDFKDFCQRLEKEKDDLQRQVQSQQNQMRKKDGRIKSLRKQLEEIRKEPVAIHKTDDIDEHTPAMAFGGFEEPMNDFSGDDIVPLAVSSLNASFSSVTSDQGDRAEDGNVCVLKERLKGVTDERNKFKTDNKKLLKVFKGKEAKLKIMNDNFEKLRQERDELLAERDSLDNKVHDLSENQSFVDALRGDSSLQTEIHLAKLKALCTEKDKEIERLHDILQEQVVPQNADDSFEVASLSRENEKLKMETAKLLKIDKGKTAQIMKISQDYDTTLQQKDNEIGVKSTQVQKMEELLHKAKSELDDLQKEKEQLVSNNTKLLKVNKGKDAKVKKYEAEILKKERIIVDKDADNEALQQKLMSLNTQLEVCNKQEMEFNEQIQQSIECTKKWQEQCENLERKVTELLETIRFKESEVESLIDNTKLLKTLKEEKIILEFELDCAKEELHKIKQNIESEEESRQGIHSCVDEVLREKESILSEASALQESIVESNSFNSGDDAAAGTDLKTKAATLLNENKKLLQDKNKLQKINKGKDAKLRKVEDMVSDQQRIIAEKDTDILILKENIKDLTSKVVVLEEIEEDLKYRLNIAVSDVDEWRDHCNALEDRLDAAHEAIDMKNDELERLDEDLANCRDDLENIREDYENICIERDELERSKNELMKQLDDTNCKLLQKESEIAELEGQLQSVSQEKDSLSAEISKLHKLAKGKDVKVKKAEDSVQTYELSLNEKLSHIHGLEEELCFLKEKLNQESKEKSDIETHMQSSSTAQLELEGMNRSLVERMNSLAEEMRDLKDGTEKAKSALQVKCEELAENELHISVLQNEVLTLKNIHIDLEQRKSEHDILVEEQRSQIQRLTEKIKQLESNIEETCLKINEQDQNLKYISDVASSWENRSKDLEIELDDQTKVSADANTKLDELKVVFEETCQKIRLKDNEYVVAVSEIDPLRQEIKRLNSGSSEMSSAISSLEQQLSTVLAEKDVQSQMLEENKVHIKSLQDRCRAFENQFSDTLNLIQEKEREVAQSRKKCLQSEQELEEFKSKIELKDTELTSMSEQMQGRDRSAQDFVDNLKELLSQSRSACNEKDANITALHNSLDSEKENCSQLEKVIEEMKREKQQMKNNITEIEQNASWLRQCYDEAQGNNANFHEHTRNQEEKLKTLMQENEELKTHTNKLEVVITENEKRIEHLQTSTEKLHTELDLKESGFTEALNKITVEVDCERTKNMHIQQENESIQTELGKVKEELIKSQERIQSLQSRTHSGHVEKVVDESFTKVVSSVQRASANSVDNQRLQNEIESLNDLESQIVVSSSLERHTVSGQHSTSEVEGLNNEITKLKKICKGKEMKIKKLEDMTRQINSEQKDGDSWESEESKLKESSRNELQEMELNLIKVQQERETYIKENDMLNEKYHELQSQVQTMLAERQEYEQKVCATRDQLESRIKQCQLMEEHDQRNRQEYEAVCYSLSACQANYDTLLSQSKGTEEDLMTNVTVLNQEIVQLRSSLDELNAKYEMLHHKDTEHEHTIKLKDDELHELKHLMKQNIVELEDLKRTNSLLQQSGEGLESEKLRFEELLKTEREEIQSLYEQMNELVSEKLDLECSVEQKDRDLRSAAEELRRFADDRDRLDEFIEAKQGLETEVETLKRDTNELRNRLGSKDRELVDMKSYSTEQDVTIEKLKQELININCLKEEMGKTNDSLSEQLRSSEDDHGVLRQELVSKKEACSKLSQMCQENTELIESLKLNIVNSTDEVTKVQNECANLKDEINLYKEQLQMQTNLTSVTDGLRMQCQVLQAEHELLKNDMITLEENGKRLETENDSLKTLTVQLEGLQAKPVASSDTLLQECTGGSRREGHVTTDAIEKTMMSPDIATDETLTQGNASESNQPEIQNEVNIDEIQQELMSEKELLKQKDESRMKEFADLEEKLKKKDEKIVSLLENMQEMEERLSQLSDESASSNGHVSDDTQNEIVSLKKLVEEKETKFTKALATAKKIKVQLNQANANLEKEKAEREKVELQLKETQFIEEHVSTQIDSNKCNSCIEFQSQIESHVEFSSQLQNQVQVLTENVFTLEASNKQFEEKIQDSGDVNSKLENSLQEKAALLLELQVEIENLKVELKQQHDQNEEKEHMIILLQKELESSSSHDTHQDLLKCQNELKIMIGENTSLLEQKEMKEKQLQELHEKLNELETNNSGFVSTIRVMQDEIKSYISKAESLEIDIEKVHREKADVKEVLNEKTNMLEKTTSELAHSTQENDTLLTKLDELGARIEMQETNMQVMRQELDRAEKELKDKSEEFDILKTSEARTEGVERELEESKMKIESLMNNIQEVSFVLQEKENIVIELEAKFKDKEKDLTGLTEEKDSKEIEMSLMKASLEENNRMIREKEESLCLSFQEKEKVIKELEEQIGALKSKSETSTDTLKTLESIQVELKYASDELREKNELIEKQATIISEKDIELQSVKEKDEQFAKDISNFVERESDLKGMIQLKEKELEDARLTCENLASVKKEKEELYEQVQSKSSELLQRDEKITLLLKELEGIETQLSEKDEDNNSNASESLTSQLNDLKLLNEKITTSLDEKSQELRTLEQNFETLKEEKQSLFEDLCSLQEDNVGLRSNISEANETIVHLSSENSALISKENTNQSQLQEMFSEKEFLNLAKDKLEESYNKVIAESAEKDGQIVHLNEQYTSVSSEATKLSHVNQQILNENNTLKASAIAVQLENDALSRELDSLKIQLANKEESLDKQHMSTLKGTTPNIEHDAAVVIEPPIQEIIQMETSVPLHQSLAVDISEMAAGSLPNESSHVAQAVSKVEQLTEENSLLKEKNKTLTAKLEKMLAKLKLFKDRNDSSQVEINKLKKQLDQEKDIAPMEALEAEVVSLKETLQQQNAEFSRQQDSLNEMSLVNEEKANTISELRGELVKQEEHISHIKKQLENDEMKHGEEVGNLKKVNAKALNKVTEVLEEIDVMNSALRKANESLDVETDRCRSLKNEKEDILTDINDHKQRLNNQEKQIVSLNDLIKESTQNSDDTKAKMELAERQYTDLKDQYEMIEQDNQNYQMLLEKTSIANNELKKENIRQKMLIEKIESDQSIASNTSEAENLKQECLDLTNHMQSVTQSLATAEERARTLSIEKTALVEELNAMNSQKTEKTVSENDNEDLIARLKEIEDENEALNEEVETLTTSLDDAKQALENSEVEKEGLEDQIANMVSELFENKMKNQEIFSQSNSQGMKQLEKDLAEAETEKEYLEEEMDGLRQDLIRVKKEKEEAVQAYKNVTDKNQLTESECNTLRNEIDSLKWKIDELSGIEEEFEDLKRKSVGESSDIEKQLSDLKSVIGSQKDEICKKDKIIEALSERLKSVDGPGVGSGKELTEGHIDVAMLNEQMDNQQKVSLEKITQLDENIKAISDLLEKTKAENASILKQMNKKDKQLQKFDMLKAEYQSLNDEYSKLLNDNSELAKQIEELHSKLLKSTISGDMLPDEASKAHFDRTKNTLTSRVDDLEAQCVELRQKNAELMEEKSKLELMNQEVSFARDTLQAQQDVLSGKDKDAKFQSDHETLRKQFNIAMDQKHNLQSELNLSQRSLAQRDSRCQQLAMQVSQLVEDRSYLNTQLSSLSKSLREKEQELPHVQQQYQALYRTFMLLQAKIQEQEKRAVMDYMQKSPAPSSGSVTPREGLTPALDLKRRLEATAKDQAEAGAQLLVSAAGKRLGAGMEPVIEITMQDRLGEETVELSDLAPKMLRLISSNDGRILQMMDDESSIDGEGRIRDLKLTRDGTNSYLGRLQRWMTVPTADPPIEHVERSVLP